MTHPVSVTLVKDATTVTLPAPPGGYNGTVKEYQVLGRSMAGDVFVYDHSVSEWEARIGFVMLSNSEVQDLDDFFRSTADGMMNTWTYTDSDGTTYTARFIEPELVFTKNAKNLWDVVLPLKLSKMLE